MNDYSNISGLDLFSTPFSTPIRTASASPRQQAKQTPPTAVQPLKSPQPARQMAATPQKPTAVQQAKPVPVATASASHEKPAPKAPTPSQTNTPKPEPASPSKAPVPASTQSVTPQKELVLDMSSGSGAAPVHDNTAERKAHEESEAKRKAAWEAKQAAKKQAEEAALQKLNAMSDEDAVAASVKRISTEVERLTRRNMKECVAEHLQELCRKDTEFARRTMHPRKNMIRCFKYINRMAKEYVKQEMADNDIKPDEGGYGCDVPDGIIYQLAEEFFNATDVPEDQEKEEKFVPKPYTGAPAKTTRKAQKAEKKQPKQQSKSSGSYEQMSLEGVIG